MAFPRFNPSDSSPSAASGRAGRKRMQPPPAIQSIDDLRRQARMRLLGATVLVVTVCVGLPLLFSARPRTQDQRTMVVANNQIAPAWPASGSAANANPQPQQETLPAPSPSQVAPSESLAEREEILPATTPQPTPQPVPHPVSHTAPQPRPAPEKPTAKPGAKPADKAKPAPKPKPAEKPPEKPAPKPEPKPKPAEKPAAKPPAKPAEKPAAKPAEKPRPAPKPEPKPAPKPAEKPAEKPPAKPAAKPAEKPAAKPPADDARARALLEGRKPPAAEKDNKPAATRYVIALGAFAEPSAAAALRQKATQAGVKTYTQVLETAKGQRTRVRAGPFSSREEAERAAAALRRVGLPSSLQSL
ncbi:MAG: SPOR domain-containing protein [Ottowia sp.]